MKTRTIGFLALLLFASFFIDETVAHFFAYIKNGFLDTLMNWFSHEITVFAVLVIVSGLFMYEEKKNKAIPLLFLSFFTGLVCSYFLKLLIMRLRPQGIFYIQVAIFGLSFIIPEYSFPSSHAAMAFSVLPILDKEFRKLKLFWVIFIAMIAISRIYLNQHYLSDVIAGGLLGYITGEYILKLEKKHGIKRIFFNL